MLVNYLRNFLDPQDFHIDIYNNKIHINNYEKIISLGTTKIIIKVNNQQINLFGTNFSLNKLADSELLITGSLESLEIKHE